MPLRVAPPFEVRAAFVLAFLAGCVDAVGFSQFGGIFVSFMSGNTTRLGLHLAAGEWLAAVPIVGVIVAFVLGAATGTAIGQSGVRRRRTILLAGEATALLTAVALGKVGWREAATLPMAFGMGMENEVFVDAAGETRIGLTFVSGTLVKLGEALGRSAAGGSQAAWSRFFLLWLSLIAGVVAGGLGAASIALSTLEFVAGVLVVLAIVFMKVDAGRDPPRFRGPRDSDTSDIGG